MKSFVLSFVLLFTISFSFAQNKEMNDQWGLQYKTASLANSEGEWKRFDKPVIDISLDSTAYDALMMANPAITVDEKGRAILIYKQVAKNGVLRGGKVRFGVAFANSLLGPYPSPTGYLPHFLF